MSTLPIETIRQIVEDIAEGVNVQSHYQHLLVLSLSCSLLHHEAQRVLFRNLALHPAPKACNKNIMLLDTLLSSPNRLALYAKTFKITYYGWPRPDSDKTARLIKKLSSALQAMCNLKSLHVAHRLYRMPLLSSILEGLQFKLTSFCWSGRWDTVSHDASVKANFLRHQDEIEHLEILAFIDGTTLESIAADMCPRLRSLSAPYPVTQLILPNKKHVMSLRWILSLGECFIPEDFKINSLFRLDLISTELANIRYLCYEKDDNKMPALQDIAPHLKSLVCLETNREEIKVHLMTTYIL